MNDRLHNARKKREAFAEEQNRFEKLYHSDFVRLWKETVVSFESMNNESETEKTDEFKYIYGNKKNKPIYAKRMFLCPDLKDIITVMDDYGDNKEKCRELFDNFKLKFDTLTDFNNLPTGIWYNTTEKGINLRPGLLKDHTFEFTAPLTMQDENVHGVVVGRTGSGKSVFLNNLIMNLLIEYAPWELELYLIDLKKVELSKYVTSEKAKAPHVKACAATGEIRYVLSLIEKIKDIMDDRETLFSRLGVTDIGEFRKLNPDVIIPRILLVVDEFQQMFLDATPKQTSHIQDLLTAITRKGRATGIHLFFASQEMRGTGVQLTNFKIRFALSCEADVSQGIIGNAEAENLPPKGYVILNDKSGDKEDNRIYQVPIIEDEDEKDGSYLVNRGRVSWLRELNHLSDSIEYWFEKIQKYYLEDKQLKLSELDVFLKIDKIFQMRNSIANDRSGQFFSSIVLGNSVIYNQKRYDIENIIIERGKCKGILVISPNPQDLAYMQNLLAVNFKNIEYSTQDYDNIYEHSLFPPQHCGYYYFDLNPTVSSLYSTFKEDVGLTELNHENVQAFNRFDEFKNVSSVFENRKSIVQLLQKQLSFSQYFMERINKMYNSNDSFVRVANYYYNLKSDDNKTGIPLIDFILLELGISERVKQAELDLNEMLPILFEEITQEFELHLNELYDISENEIDKIYELNLRCLIENTLSQSISEYYVYNVVKTSNGKRTLPYSVFNPIVVFISGIENVDRITSEFRNFILDCMDCNMYCVFFSSSAVDPDIKKACNYFFVGGFDGDLYEKYIDYSPSRNNGSITIECRIQSISKIFGFKKYKTNYIGKYMSEIDFDALLLDK